MFWLDIIYKIIKVFKDGATPGQIAWGLTLGTMMGLMPGWPLQVIILLIISLILNVNLTMVGLGAVVSSLISWALDPLLNSLGSYVLTDIPQLTGLFTIMFNSTFWMLTRFNNTVVMGGFVLGVFSAVPLYFIFKQMVVLIRKNIVTKLADSKLAKVIKRSWIYGIYSKINAVGTRI